MILTSSKEGDNFLQLPKTLFCIGLAVTASACNSPGFNGPIRPVALAHVHGGVGHPSFVCEKNGEFKSGSILNEDDIKTHNLGYSFSANVCDSLRHGDSSVKARKMLQSGFTLVKVRCNDFFAVKASRQTKARATRSFFRPLTTAITSTFSVINFGGEDNEGDALALLTAGTVLGGALIDIYEEQFLFDADNIYAVRSLTMQALDVHREEVVARGVPSFDVAVRQLADHQMICTPASILGLTRTAIQNEELEPRQPAPPIGPSQPIDEEEGSEAPTPEAVGLRSRTT